MKLNFFSNKNNQTTTPPIPFQKGRKNNNRNTKPVPVDRLEKPVPVDGVEKPVPVDGVDLKLYDTVPN